MEASSDASRQDAPLGDSRNPDARPADASVPEGGAPDGGCGPCLGGTCVAGTCQCPPGKTPCAGVCVDLQKDNSNCGACGAPCTSGTTCVTGKCQCAAGLLACGGSCIDPSSDPLNCGGCGKACTGGTACVSGKCQCPAWLPVLCGGVCTDPSTDAANCGGCGKACPAGTSCQGGVCCPAGQSNCGGKCVDTATDLGNCGKCGNACTGGQVCLGGACGCRTYQKLCSGICVAASIDPSNCGGCGVKCPAGQSCSAGACSTSCLPGLTPCAGFCVDLLADSANCGACGNPCPPGTGCVEGTCKSTVPVGPAPSKCTGGGPPIMIITGTAQKCAGLLAQATFAWALCSCDFVKLGTTAVFDAYDSTKGPYKAPGEPGAGLGFDGAYSSVGPVSVSGSTWSSTTGGVTSTSVVGIQHELHVGGPLVSSAQCTVGLDGWVGGNISVTAPLSFGKTLYSPPAATISGTVGYAALVKQPVSVPPPCKCAPADLVPVAAIVAARKAPNNDNALIGLNPAVLATPGGPQRLDLPCGNYYLSGVNSGGSPVTIFAHGRTALYIDGDLAGNAITLGLDPGGELDVFVAGNIQTTGNLTIGSPNYPALSRTYIGGSSAGLAGNTTVGGYIYAAAAAIAISSPFEVYGGLFAGSYSNLGAETYIHYDRAVLNAGYNCPPAPKQCKDCTDCGNQACVNGTCGACTASSQCCPPLICVNGTCLNLGDLWIPPKP